MISLAPLCDLPALESERLLLRRLCMRDAPDIYDYSRDAEVARHVLWTAHTSPSESRSYIRYMLRRYRLGEPSSWGIVLKREGRVIGTIGFMWIQEENASAEVGYSLGRAFIYATPEAALLKLPYQILQAAVGALVGTLLVWKCGLRKLFNEKLMK